MYAALSWVPRGVSTVKLPPPPPPEEAAGAPAAAARTAAAADANSDSDGSVDVADVLAADLDSLAVFPSNREDPYLAADDDACAMFDGEEMEDLRVRPTDVLVVAAKSGDDASTLEFHLLEDDPAESDDEAPYKPHFFVHHDVVLPTLPLCTAVTSLELGGERLNLVAVGCFTPGIDVWDVDLVNVLEPAAVLGGYESPSEQAPAVAAAARAAKSARSKRSSKSTGRRRRPKLRLKEDSHTDAVMSLSWNPVQREYLASGSADTAVKVWDVESAHCARTFTHHAGKVQSVAWHPTEERTLLTGAFDASVQLVDVRAAERPAHTLFTVASDVESVVWGVGPLEDRILAATEDGTVSIFDRRRPGAAISSFRAHTAAVSALAVSDDVAGLLVTASVDKTLKVWDARLCAAGGSAVPELVHERASRAGAVFSAALCPVGGGGGSGAASPFSLAYAGAKGVLVIADLAVESAAVRDRFADLTTPEAAAVIKKRAARVRAAAETRDMNTARRRAVNGKMADSPDASDESSDGDSESESETDSAEDGGEGDVRARS
jgi:periodic tryptophan protein 1